MPISLTANISIYQNKLMYENNYLLLFESKKYLAFFKAITITKIQDLSNIVIMSSTLYDFIPESRKPLHDRITFVVTTSPRFFDMNVNHINVKSLTHTNPYFLTIKDFIRFYKKNPTSNVIVIGGNEMHNYFLSKDCPLSIQPEKLYITHVLNTQMHKLDDLPTKFMDNIDCRYFLMAYSEKLEHYGMQFRILTYAMANSDPAPEIQYLDLMKKIIKSNDMVIFGTRVDFNIRNLIPVTTTQQFSFGMIIDKCLIFLKEYNDKLMEIINQLKTTPFDNCITMYVLPQTTIQFNVVTEKNINYLSMQFTVITIDMHNMIFTTFVYTIIIYILALKCNMKPNRIICIAGTVHTTKDYIDLIQEQILKEPRPLPKLYLSTSIKDKSLTDITYTDFELIGYMPHGFTTIRKVF